MKDYPTPKRPDGGPLPVTREEHLALIDSALTDQWVRTGKVHDKYLEWRHDIASDPPGKRYYNSL